MYYLGVRVPNEATPKVSNVSERQDFWNNAIGDDSVGCSLRSDTINVNSKRQIISNDEHIRRSEWTIRPLDKA